MNNENRPYFFILHNKSKWAFIAQNTIYNKNSIPLEKWSASDGTYYLFCRVCYSKTDATEEMSKIHSALMHGINLYCIYGYNMDNTLLNDSAIVTIWVPDAISSKIELCTLNRRSMLVPCDISYADLKSQTEKLLNSKIIKKEAIDDTDDFYHVIC